MSDSTTSHVQRIDDGGDLLLADPPGGGGHAFAVTTQICAGADCPCTEMQLVVRRAQREGRGFIVGGEVLARAEARADGTLTRAPWATDDAEDDMPVQWMEEQLQSEWNRARLRERWRRVRGRCGDPAFPAPELPAQIDGLLPYDEAFPYEFDLVLSAGGRAYLALDCYCMQPGCTCDNVTVQFISLEPSQAELHEVVRSSIRRLDRRPIVEEGSEARAQELWQALIRRHGAQRLRDRYQDMRELARTRAPQPLAAAPKVGRNAACPCGSGKKHKRCCERG